MKKSKEYVGIVLTFIVTLMLVGMISGTVKAENIRSGEYEYSLSSGDATIEKYLGSATDVIIPSTIDGYEVKGIDNDAFLNSKISKVTIPEGITRIRFEAFKNCESLSTVNFNAVNCEGTVSPVFAGCKNLKTINIGSKVTLIGSYMFANANSGVKSVTIPEGITRIRFEAFKNCESLSTVNFNAVNCEGTVSPVFAGCKNLKTINIGSKASVKEIDNDAFANSELKSITIPENVQNISFEVFKGCKNFKDIYYGGSKQGWLKIRISDNNKELKNATIHFAKINVIEENSNKNTNPVVKTLNPPKLKSYKKNTKKITGMATKGSVVKIKIGKKTYTVKVKKNGKFKVKLRKKLKKNQKIRVYAKKNGYKRSKTIVFKVK
ncbi:leucine-rich repeat domain-containing protein [Eubacterium ventriosum]|uniref:leucine-rich repeat domain-containing protein n=1 Tax=Eubacterium ventriosum TaxID=39496 RepID=UPI001C00AF49|nr:leucine-rich repeat domain-containing protein [Eubacterium ventriosum]MBT9697166.1 leucine-rich repeat protein [Eubacterium ventriosum]